MQETVFLPQFDCVAVAKMSEDPEIEQRHSKRIRLQPKRFEGSSSNVPSTKSQPKPHQKGRIGRPRKETISAESVGRNEELTLEDLLDIPTDQRPEVSPINSRWIKAVDRGAQTVIFYQLDLRSDYPSMSRCLRLKPEASSSGTLQKPVWVASIFLGHHALDGFSVEYVTGKKELTNKEDVLKVLNYISMTPVVTTKQQTATSSTRVTRRNVVATGDIIQSRSRLSTGKKRSNDDDDSADIVEVPSSTAS